MKFQTDTVISKTVIMGCDSGSYGLIKYDTILQTTSIRQERPDTSYIGSNILPLTSTISWAITASIGVFLLRKQLSLAIMVLIKKIESAENVSIGGQNGLVLQNCDVVSNETVSVIRPLSLKAAPAINDFGENERKILSTLFKHQIHYFPNNEGKWTFTLSSESSDYKKFLMARSNLNAVDLIGKLPNEQIYLTDKGIKFCEESSPGSFSYFE